MASRPVQLALPLDLAPPAREAEPAVRVDASASLRGRIGALHLHATHDSRELTAAGRAAFLSSFERRVDPERRLPEEERRRRAAYARREHFTRLAYASAAKRAPRR